LKKNARLAVRTRCGDEQGWGNFFRLIWIAKTLIDTCSIEKNAIDFYVETKKHNINFIDRFGFDFTFLEPGIKTEEEMVLLSGKYYDLSLIELMYCELDLQLIYNNQSDMVVVLDDLVDSVYSADIVISGQSFDGHSFYSIADPPSRFFMGYQYFFLNPEFRKYKEFPKRRNIKKPGKLLIAIGDEQYLPAHVKILDALRYFQKLEITYLAKTKTYESYFFKLIKNRQAEVDFKHVQSANGIAGLLDYADFAIVSGGYTKLEAAVTNTPAIVIPTQYHQEKLAKKFGEVTGLPVLSHMSELDEDEIASAISDMLNSHEYICGDSLDYFGLAELFDGYNNFIDILDGWKS